METAIKGEIVRQRRIEKGFTLRGFAKVINISASYLSDIELGKSQPAVPILISIVKALDCPIQELIRDIDVDRNFPAARASG